VAAHPDDLEQLCAGTLARYVREGHTVTMCHVSRGDRGSFEHTMEQIAAIRDGEAAAAAGVIGAAHVTLGLSDGEVNSADPHHRDLMIDLVRATRPDVILTHHPDDYMPDHVQTSHLVEDASFVATLPLYSTSTTGARDDAGGADARRPEPLTVPALFYFDTLAGLGFQPTEYVDISDVIDRKLESLRQHQSQLVWLRDHDGVDIIEQTRVASAFRGFQAGVAYAEGFVACAKWLRVRTERLLP